jgi:uncharacterized membrane protein YfcA
MTIWWLAYPLLGIFGGFVAGLFGVGGGLTLVPFMYMLFVAQNFPPEHVMHLALGTSMATIVFTSISSMREASSLARASSSSLRPVKYALRRENIFRSSYVIAS